MGDLKLFRVHAGAVTELPSGSVALEKSLQQLIETNMEPLFGVRLLASEYSTGKKHGGRIDSLGLDENSSPVIFEYKRGMNESVINQGLFYLDWLLDHQAEIRLLVMNRVGQEAAADIDFANARLVCVAADFTRYDSHAVNQIDRNIELVRYRDFGGEFLALELWASTSATATAAGTPEVAAKARGAATQDYKGIDFLYENAPEQLRDLYDVLEASMLALGDDVTKKITKHYYAFRRIKNFASVEVHPMAKKLLIYLKINPDTLVLEPGFTRDVRTIGHLGTGDLEVTLTRVENLGRVQPLLRSSYEAN